MDSQRGVLPIHPARIRARCRGETSRGSQDGCPRTGQGWSQGMGTSLVPPTYIYHLTADPAHLGNRKTGWFRCSGGLGCHPGSPRSTQPENHGGCPTQLLCLSLPAVPPCWEQLLTLSSSSPGGEAEPWGLCWCVLPPSSHTIQQLWCLLRRGQPAAVTTGKGGHPGHHHCSADPDSMESCAGGLPALSRSGSGGRWQEKERRSLSGPTYL